MQIIETGIGRLVDSIDDLENAILGSLIRRMVREEGADRTSLGMLAESAMRQEPGIFAVSSNDTTEYWALDEHLNLIRDTRND